MSGFLCIITLDVFLVCWQQNHVGIFFKFTDFAYLQVLLSEDDLKMMIEEASANGNGGVDLETFLVIMENSPWY
jgi:hypothetical protein